MDEIDGPFGFGSVPHASLSDRIGRRDKREVTSILAKVVFLVVVVDDCIGISGGQRREDDEERTDGTPSESRGRHGNQSKKDCKAQKS